MRFSHAIPWLCLIAPFVLWTKVCTGSTGINQAAITPWDLGCKPYREDNNFDCTKEIQDFLDGLETRDWNGTLNLAGEFWRISDTGDTGDGLADDGICLKIPSKIHGLRIEGGGGILPRNYPIADYDPDTDGSRHGRTVGGFLYGGSGDRTDTMLQCDCSGVVLDAVNFMGAIVTDTDSAVWNSTSVQSNSAGIGLQVIEATNGVLGPGKFWIPSIGVAFCDVGIQMSDSSETGATENSDNCVFGFVTFASCYTAGFKAFADSNVNYSFQYVRWLGAAAGDALHFDHGGNLFVWSAEIIAGGSGDAFLRLGGNHSANNATFKVANVKWDNNADPSSTGPYICEMDGHTDHVQIIFENVLIPGDSEAGDIVAVLRGDVQFVMNDWFRFRPGIIEAHRNGSGVDAEFPTVQINRGYLVSGFPEDSIFVSTTGKNEGSEIWTGVKKAYYTAGSIDLKGRLLADYENLHADDSRVGDHVYPVLPTSDPGVAGAWYTDSGTVKVSSGP